MLRIGLLALNLVLLAAPPDPVTVMGENVLPKTDLVVRGRPRAEERLGFGAGISRFEVEEVVLGKEERKVLLVLSTDAGFFGPESTPTVAFLHRLGDGRYEGVARVDLVGEDADLRLSALRSYLEIETTKDADAKRDALHDLLMEHLRSGRRFLVWSAARELAHFTAQNADRFTPEDAAAIRGRALAAREPVLRSLLETALGNLGAERREEEAPAAEGGEVPVDRHGIPAPVEFRKMAAAFREGIESAEERLRLVRAATARYLRYAEPLLLSALSDEDGDVREAAARGLGEGLFAGAEEPLRQLLARERDRDVLRAAIDTLGYLKSKEALPAILELAKDPELERSGAFAAARIGGPLARDWLTTLRTLHSGDGEADRRMTALLDFLDSEDFVRQEEALEKVRREKLR